MDSKQHSHPLQFLNEIANEAQRESPSHSLFALFAKDKQEVDQYVQKPEIKKLIKQKKFIPNNPETFKAWVIQYLQHKANNLRAELQTYTSSFESEEKLKTYINQQYFFLHNYSNENRDLYYKAVSSGSTGDPQKAGLIIALNIILDRIKMDYKNYLQKPQLSIISKKEFQTTDYALFHYYKQVGKHEPPFEKIGKITKREAMKKQGEKYGIGGDAFANSFYHNQYGKEKNRISKTNLLHIAKAIEMLSDYPAGKSIAQDELKRAELLP